VNRKSRWSSIPGAAFDYLLGPPKRRGHLFAPPGEYRMCVPPTNSCVARAIRAISWQTEHRRARRTAGRPRPRCATAVAMRWPMPATTRGPSRTGSATDRSSTRSAHRTQPNSLSGFLARVSAIDRGACSTRREKFLKVGGGGPRAIRMVKICREEAGVSIDGMPVRVTWETSLDRVERAWFECGALLRSQLRTRREPGRAWRQMASVS
jgi:hypothetical protein